MQRPNITAITQLVWSPFDVQSWEMWHIVAFSVLITGAIEGLNRLIPVLFSGFRQLPDKSQPLTTFEVTDIACIAFSRLCTIPFVYFMVQFAWLSDGVVWALDDVTAVNTVVAFVALFLVYDFVYTPMHKLLHVRVLYPLVHKHHHRQHSPFRGNNDAMNVHPVEFFLGEFLHLATAWFLTACGMRIHVVTLLMFVVVGAVAASLNHTRFDVRIPPQLGCIFDVRNVQVNFGQYLTVWDRVWGTYQPYDTPHTKKL